jgi:hypothetical protein
MLWYQKLTRAERAKLNAELVADGQRLRRDGSIVREFTIGPLMLPCKPYVVERPPLDQGVLDRFNEIPI